MDTNLHLIKSRGMERLLALGIAALCVVLGFLLFLIAPDLPADNSGQFEFAETKLYLTNVGPGIFFALFGAAITVYSIVTQVKVEQKKLPDGQEETSYQFLQKPGMDKQEITNLRGEFLKDFRTLNKVSSELSSTKDISSDLKLKYESSTVNAKDYIMRTLWDESWGEYRDFKQWLNMGCPEPIPEKVKEPAEFYLGIDKS